MDIKQLEIFARVAEFGSFSRAAKAMDSSQSTLTRQVRQLEREVGRHLLHRNGRGATPTEAGKRFLAHSVGILRQLQIAKQEVHDDEQSPVGQVVVGLPPRIGSILAGNLAIQFHRSFPRATIRIVEGPTAAIHEWILIGRLDLGVLNNPPASPQIHYETVSTENLHLVGSSAKTEPLPAEVKTRDLHRYRVIVPCRPHVMRKLIEDACEERAVKLDIAFEIDAIAGILKLIQKGYGHGILALNTIPKNGLFQSARISAPRMVNQLMIGMPAHRPLSSLIYKTIDLIMHEARAVVSAVDR